MPSRAFFFNTQANGKKKKAEIKDTVVENKE